MDKEYEDLYKMTVGFGACEDYLDAIGSFFYDDEISSDAEYLLADIKTNNPGITDGQIVHKLIEDLRTEALSNYAICYEESPEEDVQTPKEYEEELDGYIEKFVDWAYEK